MGGGRLVEACVWVKSFVLFLYISRGVEPIIRVGLVTMIRVGTHLNNT